MVLAGSSVDAFVTFASAVGAPALDVAPHMLDAALKSTISTGGSDATNCDAVTAFATEQDHVALRIVSDVGNSVSSDSGDANIRATLDLAGAGGSSSCILFFKSNTSPLDPTKPMASQVRMLVLGLPPSPTTSTDDDAEKDEESGEPLGSSSARQQTRGLLPEQALENMYQYLHHGFNPLLRSYASRLAAGGTNSAAATGGFEEHEGGAAHTSAAEAADVQERSRELTLSLPVITKRLNELEYALQTHLQNIEVPDVRLAIDPLISSALGDSTAAIANVQDLGISDELNDKTLNRIQNGVNKWIKEIQVVTRRERDESSGTVAQEIQYWSALERALNVIQSQVDGPAVQTTLNVLKQSRRALATIVFETDTDLSAAHSRVQSTMQLMRQFPIDPLMSASSVEELTVALGNIFAHLKKLKTADEYPLPRVVKLIQVLSRDLSTQLVAILSTKKLMHMPFADATMVLNECQRLFEQWDTNSRQFRELVLSLAKRRGNERIVYRTQVDHRPLQDRLEDVRQFLSTHEKLRDVVSRVLPGVSSRVNTAASSEDVSTLPQEDTEITSVREISSAFRLMLAVDPVDVTREGVVTWESAKRAYDRCIDRLESRIIERLTDRLGAAKTADEMFRVFSKFNALFFRPRIRGAIQQFQTRLIGTVERDIEALQVKFKRTYKHSEVAQMSKVRDVPPVSGAIIWARQIERQLQLYLGRVETVLGKGWEQHVEGKRLKEAGQAFMRKLNTQQMFDGWMQSIQNVPSFEITGSIFHVEQRRGELMLRVNFDTQIVELFKEVRNLQWLGFRIKYTLKTISDEAKEKYPFAMSLTATLKTFNAVMCSLDEDLRALLAGSVKQVQNTLEMSYNKSKGVNWDADRLQDYVRDLSNQILGLQEKCYDANEKRAQAEACLMELRTCGYDRVSLGDVLLRLQSFVDELNLASYSNLEKWVAKLGERIDDILNARLESAVRGWTLAFEQGSVSVGGGSTQVVSDVCMYVCMYVCIYVYMYLCIYVYMYTCIYDYMYLCIYVSRYLGI
jgi:dynein heavy chain 1